MHKRKREEKVHGRGTDTAENEERNSRQEKKKCRPLQQRLPGQCHRLYHAEGQLAGRQAAQIPSTLNP